MTVQLAQADAHRCVGDCPVLRGRRAGLAARLDALDAEAREVRRAQAVEDRAETRRDVVRTDPVTLRLATLCGLTVTKLDLLAGLAFAAILESMACLLWWLALLPRTTTGTATRHEAVAPVTPERLNPASAVTPAVSSESLSAVATEPETDLIKLVRDVQAGIVKPTVTGIRLHLRCSQARATTLRRQLTDLAA
ncbi:hypothetical protein NX868_12595 [Burkholderia thailandensis]|nr:hypothetical protein [Burkholderia thailandensis]MCS3392752.1 hypothetical protein [Burkholderia thailandensis]MCS6454039.1 hypothetical protein [Burkholderia thailandensis]MCS6483111.1 hypothetical protein [Burkholderia thailandensis]MCS6489048.1 hypothetical protein [Burkholderia thailandensis]TBW66758.1 hypothetical protein EZV77_04760 [Burkholderia thailandensis]